MPPKNSEYSNEISNNFENTELKLKPFYHADLKNTLENIVFKDKSEKEKSLVEKVFADKSKTLKTTVKSLLNEIEFRENLDSHLLKKINDESRPHMSLGYRTPQEFLRCTPNQVPNTNIMTGT